MKTHKLFMITLLGAAACSESESSRPGELADAAVNGDGGVTLPSLTFVTSVVDNTEPVLGDNAVLALNDDGQPTLVYAVVPFETTDRVIRFARPGGDGSWIYEDIVNPGSLTAGGRFDGLGFAYVAGVPHVVYIGGDDDGVANTPFPTDLMLSTRRGGVWSETTLADTSDEAFSDCPEVQGYCNEGHIVGTHAAIAASGNAYVVGYRDTHRDFEDLNLQRADVEIVGSQIGIDRAVVDPGRSGGDYIGIALTPDNRPVLAYNLFFPSTTEDRVGVWAAVYSGTDWILRRLGAQQTSARTSVAVASDGTIYVAYYDGTNYDLVLATSTNDGLDWTTERVESSGRVGLHPDLTLDAEDRPVIAYTYCGRTENRNCPGILGGDAEVRLARRIGGNWDITVVDDGQGQGGVGLFNSVAIAPNGTIYVAFQDTINNDLLIAEAQP